MMYRRKRNGKRGKFNSLLQNFTFVILQVGQTVCVLCVKKRSLVLQLPQDHIKI